VRLSYRQIAGPGLGSAVGSPKEQLPIMLRFWAGGVAALVIIAVAVFLMLARFNNRGAEAGPPPALSVTVTTDAVQPGSLSLTRGRLYELTFANHGTLRRRLSLDSKSVESLPVSTLITDPHAGSASTAGIDLTAAAGQDVSQYVRFKSNGTYELRIDVPGRAEPALTVTVEVH
jgi:uncharacterized cupredoxin-like copper-binding protein